MLLVLCKSQSTDYYRGHLHIVGDANISRYNTITDSLVVVRSRILLCAATRNDHVLTEVFVKSTLTLYVERYQQLFLMISKSTEVLNPRLSYCELQ